MNTEIKRLKQTFLEVWNWTEYLASICSKKEKKYFCINFAAAKFAIIIIAIAPLLFATIIDNINYDQPSFTYLAAVLIAFLGLRLVSSLLGEIRWLLINPIIYKVAYHYSSATMSSLIENCSKHSRYNYVAEASESLTIIQKAQDALVTLLYSILLVLVPVILELVAISIISTIVLGPGVTILLMLVLFCIALTVIFFSDTEAVRLERAIAADNKYFRQYGQIIAYSNFIEEHNAQVFFCERLFCLSNSSLLAHKKFFEVKYLRTATRSCAVFVGYSIIFLYLLADAHGSEISGGMIFLLLAYTDRLASPFMNLSASFINIENALVNLKLQKKLFKNPLQSNFYNFDPKIDIGHSSTNIQTNIKNWPIHGLKVRNGSKVLIKGKSGTGKTTLFSQIYLNYREILKNKRPKIFISYIPATPTIFEGTVKDNLTFKNKYPPASDLWKSFWKKQLKRPYPTLTKQADSLSSGEKQLLSIIRSITRNPLMIIIDEGLNNMDSQMEEAIVKYLQNNYKGMTVFLISHKSIKNYRADLEVILSEAKNEIVVSIN